MSRWTVGPTCRAMGGGKVWVTKIRKDGHVVHEEYTYGGSRREAQAEAGAVMQRLAKESAR